MDTIPSTPVVNDQLDACVCGNPLYSHNTQCVACGAEVGFDPVSQRVVSFTTDPATGCWHTLVPELFGQAFRMCAQRVTACNCNWVLRAESNGDNCLSCQLTLLIPQLDIPGNAKLWGRAEAAKRRVLIQLLRLGLPMESKVASPIGLGFKFMASLPGEVVLTGHEDGVITLNISEADDSEREAIRERMGENYRTLAGHIRHELGHYYWDLLSHDESWLETFRSCFGDERQDDYDISLRNHYQNGAPANWALTHISAYASSHPWEDWAETFGHYLHLEEGLSLARHFGLEPNELRLSAARFSVATLPPSVDQSAGNVFIADVNRWIRLSLLINELAEGLGQPHPSPFVLNVATVAKLWHVHSSLQKLSQKT
ncbi:MAG: putative zinc-binding metallopeptidase [Luteolibacter sp.]